MQPMQKYLLIFLRSITIWLVLMLLFNPIFRFMQTQKIKPKIIFLTDSSASMQQQTAGKILADQVNALEQIIKTRINRNSHQLLEFDFANGLRGNSNNTLLQKSLVALSRETDLSAAETIFLFSDGWLRDDDFSFLDKLNLPITCFAPDWDYSEPEVKITNVLHNQTAYTEESTPINLLIRSSNFLGKIRINLRDNDRVIQTELIDIKEDEFHEIHFENQFADIGLHKMKVEIVAEDDHKNSLAEHFFAIRVLASKLNCLVVSDRLSWEVRFILNSINQDNRWQSKYLLKSQDYRYRREIADFEDDLKNVNTLILLNHGNLSFPEKDIDLIQNFVSKGGGLIFWGNGIPDLQNLLPSSPSRTNTTLEGSLRFTDRSREFQTFRFEDQNPTIPPLRYYPVSAKIDADIMAFFDNEFQTPAIIFGRYDAGKIMHFSFFDLWRWQMWTDGDGYQIFITNLINWFGQNDQERIVVNQSKLAYFEGESVDFSLTVFTEQLNPADKVEARIQIFNDKNELFVDDYFVFRSGSFNYKAEDLPAGSYHFQINEEISKLSAVGSFIVNDFSAETQDKGINWALLSYIAQKTGGDFLTDPNDFTLDSSGTIQERISYREYPLYTKWFLIAGLLSAFCLELYLRKKWGLL